MLEKVEIIKNDEKTTVDLISEFEITENGQVNRYALLTANEIDQNGLIKILAAEVSDNRLIKIESQDDWMLVKNVMRSIISSSNGDFTYYNFGEDLSFSCDDDFARVIAIQEVAKQQLIKDYQEKKPDPATEDANQEEEVDPNAIIYPEEEKSDENTTGDEVIPGIAELTQMEVADEEEAPLANEIINNPMEEEAVVGVEEPKEEVKPVLNEEVSTNNNARDIMINRIIEAVDEYIKSVGVGSGNNDIEINALKTSVTAMEDQLKKMSEALKAQE